jgi:prepilin-type N-terminal cleavage/methylation domain-containing protein
MISSDPPPSAHGLWRRHSLGGYTLLELLVSVALILVLLALAVPISDSFRRAAKKARCLSHMRTIHAGFVAHIEDKGRWPQMEEDEFDFTDDKFFGFWIRSLEPYGVAPEAWICPSDRNPALEEKEAAAESYGSYVPTRFDASAATPFRWNQPWLMERGDLHGKGAHIVMPDGSITGSREAFSGR